MAKITVNDFAARIGKTPPRVRQLITEGIIKAEKIGRDWLIDERQVEKVKSRKNQRNRK